MSGEMVTSLGNGFTNLILNEFVASRVGCKLVGFVEGDDGLFAGTGPVPKVSDYEEIGFTMKMAKRDSVLEASFCGIVCGQDYVNVIDPIKNLVKFGWTHSAQMHSKKRKVQMGLLRAKAYSLYYEAPQCPLTSVFAKRVLELTKGVKPIFDTEYRTVEIMKGIEPDVLHYFGPITPISRELVQHRYEIPVCTQIALEKKFEKMNLGMLHLPELEPMFPSDWVDNWVLRVREQGASGPMGFYI
jgi:hypothetical protein